MGHSRAEKAASRERILEAAARHIGKNGLESVSVGELMKDAGLTKGAFYGHFESRDALLAEAVKRAMEQGQAKIAPLFAGSRKPTLEQLVDAWLNPAHIASATGGCGICSLAGEARYAGPRVQQVIAEQFKTNIKQFVAVLGGTVASTGSQARAILTAIVGAVSVARAVGDPKLARGVVESTRAMILQSNGRSNP